MRCFSVAFLMAFFLFACDVEDQQAESIQGEQGLQGDPGKEGKTGNGCHAQKTGEGVWIICGDSVLLLEHAEDGKPGKPGVNGTKGEKGDKGAPGLPGEDGVSCSVIELENGVILTCGEEEFFLEKGVPGKKGEPGIQGPAGTKGDKGEPGIQGLPGMKGDKGNPGAQGSAGATGDKGNPGTQGSVGAKGDKGDPGVQGPGGTKGDKGDQGQQGIQGSKGGKGDTGAKGAKGDKGDPGPQGPPGEPTCPDGTLQYGLNGHGFGCMKILEFDGPKTFLGCMEECMHQGFRMMELEDVAALCLAEPDYFDAYLNQNFYILYQGGANMQFRPAGNAFAHKGMSICQAVDFFAVEQIENGKRIFLSWFAYFVGTATDPNSQTYPHPNNCLCTRRLM